VTTRGVELASASFDAFWRDGRRIAPHRVYFGAVDGAPVVVREESRGRLVPPRFSPAATGCDEQQIVARLRHGSWQQRLATLHALVASEDPRFAAPEIRIAVEALTHSCDGWIREAAAQALSQSDVR
jgi:hypothetical protein